MIVALPGQNVTLNWTFVGILVYSQWYFTRRSAGSRQQLLVVNYFDARYHIFDDILPRVSFEKPATLVLRNVDALYNGKYMLWANGEPSSVEFFVAGKYFLKCFFKSRICI